ncbi:iron-containing alcohol dehydrogenase family protein [Anaerobacillus alkaliphilus]|nr:iron-containing alcohol dehydrogenase family protein [Anaerobacillus alkaliphilus]
MMQAIQVQAGPSVYQCEEDVLLSLEEKLLKYGFRNVLVIHGEKSWKAVEPYFPAFKELVATFVPYSGHCSENEIDRVAEHQADVIVGIGGGTVLDLTKAVANKIGKDAVLIPTLAATCAAWTPLSVIYDDQDRFVRFEVFPRANLLVLIEPRVLLTSPPEYLRAGIADTLAKWYEARALTEQLETKRVSIELAVNTAKLCKDVLLEHGAAAIEALNKGVSNHSFIQVIETNILAGGLVGSLGDRYGRIAAAHSVHNALTQFEETHHLLHGEKVAYGILVQLALEKRVDELVELQPYYHELQLPYLFTHLKLDFESLETKQKIAEWTLKKGESIHMMGQYFTEEDIILALETVEETLKKLLKGRYST